MVQVTDEELKTALNELFASNASAGAKQIRQLLKDKHNDWEVSEKRVGKVWSMVYLIIFIYYR